MPDSHSRPKLWPFHFMVLATIAIPITLFAVGAWQSRVQLYQTAEDRAARQVASLYEHARKVLQAQEMLIQQATMLIKDMSWPEVRKSQAVWDAVRKMVVPFAPVDALFMLDGDGRLALTTRAFPMPPMDFSDRDYFTAQREQDAGTFLSATYQGKISAHPIFNLSNRRPSPTGVFDGVIGVSVSIAYFRDFYETVIGPRPGTNVELVRTDGERLVAYPAVGSSHPFSDKLMARLGRDREGVVYGSLEGRPTLLSYKRLGELPAYIVYDIDERAIRADWYRSMVPWAVLALAAALLLAFSTGWAIRRERQQAHARLELQQAVDDLHAEVGRRRQAEASLLAAQKLDALGRFTAGIAHDFANLLQVMGTCLERADPLVKNESARTLLAHGGKAVGQGQQLVRHLLAFARKQPLTFEIVDLNERLTQLQDVLRQISPIIQIELALAGDLWPVELDPSQLDMAVVNLVINARDAMPEGGVIRIETENQQLDGAHGLAGSFVALTVRDQGQGMPPEVLAQALEPFFTTKPVGQGTGLGLSTIYGFVTQSGGNVAIASEVGKGTTVTLYLPKGAPNVFLGERSASDAAAPGVLPFRRSKTR